MNAKLKKSLLSLVAIAAIAIAAPGLGDALAQGWGGPGYGQHRMGGMGPGMGPMGGRGPCAVTGDSAAAPTAVGPGFCQKALPDEAAVEKQLQEQAAKLNLSDAQKSAWDAYADALHKQWQARQAAMTHRQTMSGDQAAWFQEHQTYRNAVWTQRQAVRDAYQSLAATLTPEQLAALGPNQRGGRGFTRGHGFRNGRGGCPRAGTVTQ